MDDASFEEIAAIVEEHPDLVDKEVEFFGTPVFKAAGRNRPRVVALLLDKGADINQVSRADNNNGYTLLHYAVATDNVELAKLLFDRGADTTIRTDEHGTALDIARKRGHQDLAKLIEEHSKKTNASGSPE